MLFIEDVVEIIYGLKTNGNDIFYLPSKYWGYSLENEKFLILKNSDGKIIKISKKSLKPLIRMAHLKDENYHVKSLSKLKKEDYALNVDNISGIDDKGTQEYINWVTDFIITENKTNNRYPSLIRKMKFETWTKLPEKSGGKFLFKSAIHKNFSVLYNNNLDVQIDSRLYFAYSKINVDNKIIFAVLNSVITYIGMELLGRTNLGEGALDIKIIDYNKIPVINPRFLKEQLEDNGELEDFIKNVEKILEMKPFNIELEVKNKYRLKMDQMILKLLGFSEKEVQGLYNDLMDLVKLREKRAKSIKKSKNK